MSTTATLPNRTRKDILDAIDEKNQAIKSLETKGGANLDALLPEEFDSLTGLLDERDALNSELEKFPKADALKSRIDKGNAAAKNIRRPAMGGGTTKRTAPADDDDEPTGGLAELVESEDDKYIKSGPFKSLGHFAYAVRMAGQVPGKWNGDDPLGEWNARIGKVDHAIKSMNSATKALSGLGEFADSEGAAFVPPQISNQVWERAMADDANLLARVDSTPVSGNGFKVWAWNDKSRSGSTLYGGAKAYWGAEAAQFTSSKPTTREIDFRLKKLYVFMYASDELLEDTVALDARLAKVAGACFAYKINEAIISGDGQNQPQGIIGSAARITQTAVSAQGANTIVGKNIDDMFARRSPGSVSRLIWLYNIDCEPQFNGLNYSATNSTTGVTAQWIYVPPGGMSSAPYGTLRGRPLVECEHCSALGTEGDVILWDPASYGVIVKNTGINQAVSMHLRFDYGETAFRWVFRMDGRPMWDAPLTPANGATRSPIVTLNSTRT